MTIKYKKKYRGGGDPLKRSPRSSMNLNKSSKRSRSRSPSPSPSQNSILIPPKTPIRPTITKPGMQMPGLGLTLDLGKAKQAAIEISHEKDDIRFQEEKNKDTEEIRQQNILKGTHTKIAPYSNEDEQIDQTIRTPVKNQEITNNKLIYNRASADNVTLSPWDTRLLKSRKTSNTNPPPLGGKKRKTRKSKKSKKSRRKTRKTKRRRNSKK